MIRSADYYLIPKSYIVEEIMFHTLSNINIYHIVGMLHYGGRSIFCNKEQNAFDKKLHFHLQFILLRDMA